MMRELQWKLKGYSKLAPVDAVIEKVKAKAKLNGPDALMADALAELTRMRESTPGPAVLELWIKSRQESLVHETRTLIARSARNKWAITIGQGWFKDAKTLDDNEFQFEDAGYGTIKGKAELREVEVKI